MSKSVVFFGTEAISATSLQALIDNDWMIEAVITKPDSPRGRHGTPRAPLVKTIALEHNIRVLQPQKVSEILNEHFESTAAILVSYGKIIPKSVIDLFPVGIVNVHPSLLPKYRGPTPFQTAILNGDTESGVSLMKLVEAMDAGPIYAQTSYPLRGTETAETLGQQLAVIGASMLVEKLPQIIDESLAPIPQDDTQATYCHLFTKDMGIINWDKPAQVLEREIRAYFEWPKSTATLGSVACIIKKAHLVDEQGKPGTWRIEGNDLIVFAGDKALAIDELQPAGKTTMSTASFLAGNQL